MTVATKNLRSHNAAKPGTPPPAKPSKAAAKSAGPPTSPTKPTEHTSDTLIADFTERLDQLKREHQASIDSQTAGLKLLIEDLEKKLPDRVDKEVRKQVAPILQQQHAVQAEVLELQQKVKDLEDRLESSLECSTSQADTSDQTGKDKRWPAKSSSGQMESVVRQLASCKKQERDSEDQEARKAKELNAVLRNVAQTDDETDESLTTEVNVLFSDTMGTAVEAASVKRSKKPGNGTAPGIVLVQFKTKADKRAVFKARSKLAGTRIGLDEDLTRLQQERKRAAWPVFKDLKAKGTKTQWRAEKLFVLEDGHFVEHKVLSL